MKLCVCLSFVWLPMAPLLAGVLGIRRFGEHAVAHPARGAECLAVRDAVGWLRLVQIDDGLVEQPRPELDDVRQGLARIEVARLDAGVIGRIELDQFR